MRREATEKPATERQREILDVIAGFTAQHGYPPSVREIGELVGLSSSSTIHAHLNAPRPTRPCPTLWSFRSWGA